MRRCIVFEKSLSCICFTSTFYGMLPETLHLHSCFGYLRRNSCLSFG